jgi:hypothetical protein
MDVRAAVAVAAGKPLEVTTVETDRRSTHTKSSATHTMGSRPNPFTGPDSWRSWRAVLSLARCRSSNRGGYGFTSAKTKNDNLTAVT